MEQYEKIQQLLKKEPGTKERVPIFPPTVIQAVFDAKTGASLEAILAQFNSVFVQFQGTQKATRNIIPLEMRRKGLKISYTDMDGVTIEEQCRSDLNRFTDDFGNDENWIRYDNLLENIEKTYYIALERVIEVIDKLKEGVTPDMLSESVKQLLSEAGATITNLPDEEDLTTTGGTAPTLKFKDKEYLPEIASGMGRVYLRKNFVNGKNILTQELINKPNTIYIIQYDYNLNGAEITIPEGCVLDFQGGSLSNGVIILNKTKLGNSNLKIFKDILLQGTSGSDIYLSMYEWDATYTENNYNILYNIYSVIRNTDFQVVWDIKDIFLIQNKDSIYLDNNKVHDFNNTTIHIHSKINACLFNIEGNYIQTSYIAISNAIQDNFFKNKYGVILVKDLTPLYKRPGYSDTYYREDVLLVENNRLLSSPILEYDNDTETKAEIYFIDADSKVVFKNLVFDRRGSQNIVSLLQISKCYNPIISNITVDSDNENNLTAEMGIISIKESYNPYLEDITISNTHGSAVGSGLYSYSILLLFVSNAVIKRLTAASAWHTFGCRGINGITVYDSNIDGFDNHVYSCNFKFENCNFHTYFIEDPEIGYLLFDDCTFNKCSPSTASTGVPYSGKSHRIYNNCSFIDIKEGLRVISGYTSIENPRALLKKMDGKPALSVYNCKFILNSEAKVPTIYDVKSSLPDHLSNLPGSINIDIDGITIEDNVGRKFDLYIINEILGKEIDSNVSISNVYADNNSDWHISLDTTTITGSGLVIKNSNIPVRVNNISAPKNTIIQNSIIGDIQVDIKSKVLNFDNCIIYFLVKDGNTIQQGFYDNCLFYLIGEASEDFFVRHYSNANVVLKNCKFDNGKLLIRHNELRNNISAEEEKLVISGVSNLTYNKYTAPQYITKDLDYLYITEGIAKVTAQELEVLLKYKLLSVGHIILTNGTYKYIINNVEVSQDEYYYNIYGIDSKSKTRPSLSDSSYNIGVSHFDTTLNKPIWWTGSKWVDATGAEV